MKGSERLRLRLWWRGVGRPEKTALVTNNENYFLLSRGARVPYHLGLTDTSSSIQSSRQVWNFKPEPAMGFWGNGALESQYLVNLLGLLSFKC